MRLVSPRSIVIALAGAAAAGLAVSSLASADGKDSTFVEFVARARNVSDAADAGPIAIRIVRWSTDEEMERLRGVLLDRRGAVGPVFPARPAAAVVLMPGVQGLGARARTRRTRSFQFARQITTPAGRQIVLATDEHPGLGEDGRAAMPSGAEFALLDIRLDPEGKGVGKLAPAASVVYNKTKKILEIADFAAQPVRLVDVKPVER